MKKTTIILASMLVCSAGYAQQFGDYNNDEKVNVADATKLTQLLVDDDTFIFDRDVNGDGSFNISDVTRLVQYILDDELPARPVACVDLGLSVKWAAFNLGAASETEVGNFYAWGETAPKDQYTTGNSATDGKNMSYLLTAGIIDEEGDLTAEYDAASVAYGDGWRMPTSAEIQELLSSCTWEDCDDYFPVRGVKITGPNGQSIFLARGGEKKDGDVINENHGYFWSSTCDDMSDAFGDFRGFSMGFAHNDTKRVFCDYRYRGRNIRPVKD